MNSKLCVARISRCVARFYQNAQIWQNFQFILQKRSWNSILSIFCTKLNQKISCVAKKILTQKCVANQKSLEYTVNKWTAPFHISIIFKSFLAFTHKKTIRWHASWHLQGNSRKSLSSYYACMHPQLFNCSFYAILENFMQKRSLVCMHAHQ